MKYSLLQSEGFPIVSISNRDSKYVIALLSGGSKYLDTYYAKMINPALNKFDWKFLFPKEEKISSYIIKEEEFIFLTGKNSSNFQICKTVLNNPDFKNPMSVSTTGWLNGGRRYTYDFENKRFEEVNLVPIAQFPEFEDLIVKEVLVKSHDGVEVPLSWLWCLWDFNESIFRPQLFTIYQRRRCFGFPPC